MSYENHKNNENQKIPFNNIENHENFRITYENHESHENLGNSQESIKKQMKIFEIHMRNIKIKKIKRNP